MGFKNDTISNVSLAIRNYKYAVPIPDIGWAK